MTLQRFLSPLCLAGWIALACLVSPPTLLAQAPARVAKADASVAVEGVIRQVFRSSRQGRNDYVVQVEVARAEARRRLDANAKVTMPVPGDMIYVHLTQALDPQGRVVAGQSHANLPGERSLIKAFLTPRASGGWEGTFPEWVEVAKAEAEAAPTDLPPASDLPTARPAASGLGATLEALKVQGRLVLKVNGLDKGGAAQESGLEVGEVIVGANGAELTSPDQLDQLAATGKPFTVIVVDVNSGKASEVPVKPKAAGPLAPREVTEAPPANTPAPPAGTPGKVSLGISAEEVRLGNRSALKVTRVEAGGLAAKAGIEVNDVIVAANGIPTTGPEQLVSALRKSGSTLTLTIRDSRTNKDVPVEVALGTGRAEPQLPKTGNNPLPGVAGGRLGAVTELAFHNDEFAVKITEVEPGSPAERAGLKAGLLVTQVNGKSVLHPNELNDAVRLAGGKVRLTLVEPSSGRSANVDISLAN